MAKKFRTLEEFLHEKLQDPDFAIEYLNTALADEDKQIFLIALKNVVEARAHTIATLAKNTDISRQNIYRMLSDKGNPRWSNITALMNEMNLQINISQKNRLSHFTVESETKINNLREIFNKFSKEHGFDKLISPKGANKDSIENEVADIAVALLKFCSTLNIDLSHAIEHKMHPNNQKHTIKK